MSEYKCPLCHQSVSPTLYRKITGIWEETQKLKKKVEEERAKLKRRLAKEEKKFQRKMTKLKEQQARLVKEAVGKRTKRFEKQIADIKLKEKQTLKNARRELSALKHREKQIKRSAQNKVQQLERREKQVRQKAQEEIKSAKKQADTRAERLAKKQFKSFKRQLQNSIKSQVKRARKNEREQVKIKYAKLENTFKSTLGQMKTKNKELRRQGEQIKELERQLESRTTPQIEGLLFEDKLAKELRERFPGDRVERKGKRGDVLHFVKQKDQEVGVIVYECKRVKHYKRDHVRQAAEAKEKREADFAILVTSAMKKSTQGLFVERGVIVVHPAGVLSIVGILRQQIIQIAAMKLGQLQKKEAVKLVMEYLEGPEFTNSMDAIIQESISACDELNDEMEKHKIRWNKRYLMYSKIHGEAVSVKGKSKTLLSGEQVPAKKIFLPTPEELKIPAKKKKPVGVAVVEAGDDSVKEY